MPHRRRRPSSLTKTATEPSAWGIALESDRIIRRGLHRLVGLLGHHSQAADQIIGLLQRLPYGWLLAPRSNGLQARIVSRNSQGEAK